MCVCVCVSGLIHSHAGALRCRQDKIRHGSVSHQLFPPIFSTLVTHAGYLQVMPSQHLLQQLHVSITPVRCQDPPDHSKGRKLLEVKGKVEAEARFEEGSDGF